MMHFSHVFFSTGKRIFYVIHIESIETFTIHIQQSLLEKTALFVQKFHLKIRNPFLSRSIFLPSENIIKHQCFLNMILTEMIKDILNHNFSFFHLSIP